MERHLSMQRVRWLTLRLFGVTALVAVASFWWQLPGLSGSQGIAPIADLMKALSRPESGAGFWSLPSVFWLSASDGMLHAVAAVACAAAVGLTLNLWPRLSLFVFWAAWLSFVITASPWLGYQWDRLLLEGAFVLFFFAPRGLRPGVAKAAEPGAAVRFALAFLAMKLTLESGVVKLLSGDPAWRDLSALTFHWWSQPLPTWTAVLAHQWPLAVQQGLCLAVFFLELPIPLLALGPRTARRIAAGGLITLQLALAASGNFAYYSLLAVVLALPLLDDEALLALWPRWLRRLWIEPEAALTPAAQTASPEASAAATPPAEVAAAAPTPTPPRARPPVWQLALVTGYILVSVSGFMGRAGGGTFLREVTSRLSAFASINAYGAFAVMTKTRPEIELQGSADGVDWKPYAFPHKPGDVTRRPGFIAPLQPRLDWQMWFASLGTCDDNPWLLATQWHLLRGTPAVLRLFDGNPFEAAPPKYLRSRVFEYRFAPLGEAGVWWHREPSGDYCPEVMLGPQGQLVRAWPG